MAIQLVSRSNSKIKGNAVQTQYKPDLLVEKGKKVGTGGQVNRVSPALDLLASHSIRWLYRTKWDQPRYHVLMFVAPSHSYVMPLVKCSSRTVKSKDTLNQCCFQCNASSMNQWHFFTCPAKISQ